MARGRKPRPLPIDYIKFLHEEEGYTLRAVAYILERQLGLKVSYSTLSRRLSKERRKQEVVSFDP